MKLKLPFPVSANVYYRKVGNRMLISAKGRQYKHNVYAAVLEQLGLFKPLTGPLRITIELFPPNKIRRDLDNFAGKALYDALVFANCMLDDSQIKESHNYMREPDKDDPGCDVILEELHAIQADHMRQELGL